MNKTRLSKKSPFTRVEAIYPWIETAWNVASLNDDDLSDIRVCLELTRQMRKVENLTHEEINSICYRWLVEKDYFNSTKLN